jgi:hypothetical protein
MYLSFYASLVAVLYNILLARDLAEPLKTFARLRACPTRFPSLPREDSATLQCEVSQATSVPLY